jgi:N-acetylglucosaminyl-diphospho-decaprenol L-rhamnosyltransferase
VTFESATTVDAALTSLPLDRLAGAVVVDNASNDASAAQAEAAGAHVVRLDTNVGFGAGVDAAIAAAPPADHVLVLNPDAAITSDDLATLVAYLDRHPSCALVGPRMSRDGEPLTSAGRPATLATELRLVTPAPLSRRLPDRRFRPAYATTGPVGYVEGACVVVRRAALDAVGGFGPGWFLFYEELDLAQRFRRAGWTVDLCAEAQAKHAVAVSRRSSDLGAMPHLFAGTTRYLRRWHGRPAAAAFSGGARATWWWRASRGRLPAPDRRLLARAVRDAR